jgi:hypothetical protein
MITLESYQQTYAYDTGNNLTNRTCLSLAKGLLGGFNSHIYYNTKFKKQLN